MFQQIIDRRLAGKNKSIGNRERFLRRHKEQIREAVKRAVDGRGIRDMEKGEEIFGAAIPMKRMGTAEELASAICFFLSDDSSFVTGQTLIVDGGVWPTTHGPATLGCVALVVTTAYAVPLASSVVAPTVAVVAPVAVPTGEVSVGAVVSGAE